MPFPSVTGDGLARRHIRQLVYLPAGPANFDAIRLLVHRKAKGQHQFAAER